MRWLTKILGRKRPVPYRDLDLGLIKAYSLIIPKGDIETFLAQGWREAPDFRDFHYRPNADETVMLTKPITLSESDTSVLIGQRITGFSTYYGSYGMGGPGFMGLSLSDQPPDHEVVIYAVWGASEYTLLDEREIECHPRYYDERHPWRSLFADEDVPNWDELSPVLIGCQIESVELTQDHFALRLNKESQSHLLEFVKNDPRLPDHGGGEPRRDAFKVGVIGDYIVFQHKNAILWV
ncbi:MAG: hypothetical protein KC547_02520 [Anaerolineae bacterium]|nr:hypothetical protein [Anaerolineae bacterium]